MRISSLNGALNGDDILSLIEDWVYIPGLTVENIVIKDEIEINGQYKVIIKIPFKITLSLEGTSKECIYLNLTSIKLYKLQIYSFFRKLALKKVIEDLKDEGIAFNEGRIIIYINKLLKKAPVFLNLNLKDLFLKDGFVNVEVMNINFSMTRPIEDNVKIESEEVEQSVLILNKTKDSYTQLKCLVGEKVPEKYEPVFKYVMIIPDLIALIFRLFKDKRVPTKVKVAVSLSITYVASPIDILPDDIPFIGRIDDVAMIFFALNKILNSVDEIVILENWEGEEDIITVIKEGINYVNGFAGGERVNKIYNVF
ncbi:YkvA family protein [Clostridium frigidicarnis]|uniref:Uncharacterized membrane protein YkvA, DUF1232 family n=1 Tax=Clostridium frigidicarnis TaxID=84698 RepID=A0A1I0WYR1_9CLOT|nr:DUF1232 domain-containing protein [Clostridium frigidicarnis]SFA93290.1 Uncharacterized membrane protein YkvA, DUF1232 family [Clostridium frigidicarnis]